MHMHTTFRVFLMLSGLAVLAVFWAPPAASAATPPALEWTRQFGADISATDDVASAVDADADGNVYVGGHTTGTLPGQADGGGDDVDAYVRKYDSSGTELWTHQFGTSLSDQVRGVSADADGNVYVAGSTENALPGQVIAGFHDAFVRKYDSNGTVLWTRQFGSLAIDVATGVSVDGSDVYVAGKASGVLPGQVSAGLFVRKYNSEGTEIWTRLFGILSRQQLSGVAADASGVYVVGETGSVGAVGVSLGGQDAFVRKYDNDGNVLWTRQFGTGGHDQAFSVAADGSDVYVAGLTTGTLPGQAAGGCDNCLVADAFVRKYDSSGTELWTRQFGTSLNDSAGGVAVDATGLYVTGKTDGTLPGQVSAGSTDAFVRKYDGVGTELWTHQFGTSASDEARGVSADVSGVYAAGETSGTLPGQVSAGGRDAYVIKLSQAPTNQLPTADAGGPYLVAVSSSIAFDGSGSSDPDDDSLTETWSADGGTVAGSAYTAGEVPGIYDVCLTVNDGTVGSEPNCTIVVVYDPSGGFVTGGGWFDSPAGAYTADPDLTGKATFGFVSKYKKGASVPTGNTSFAFDLAGLAFYSDSYEWLVVNQGGANAQFKGSGTVNGALDPNGEPYKFMLWAGDGSPDTFRIKIWSEDASGIETVVYDNGFEGSGYESGQPIGAGNIVVHKEK